MAQVLFSFDTEDYTNPDSDEAILRVASLLTSQGIRGCFNIVGELAVALEERSRRDVINALSAHEINFHSWRHTWHPTIVEYGDVQDWDAGYQRFLMEERRASQAVKRIFGKERLFSAVPPGNCIASQAPYVYHDLDIPIYSGSLFKKTKGKTIWYCNQINLENNLYLDDVLWGKGADAFLAQEADSYLDYERVIVCMHPNMSLYREFWDALNCLGKNQVEFGKWNYPERRSKQEIEEFFEGFRKILRYFKSTPGYEIVTYEDIYRQERDKRHPLTVPRLLELLAKAKENFFFAAQGGESFSLAELYEASVHFASGGIGGFTPRAKRGPINMPYEIAQPITLQAADVKKAAWENRVFDSVPQMISVGAVKIGPADFMWAVAQLLEGKETIVLEPFDCTVNTLGYYSFDDFKLKGTWMHSKEFTDEFTTGRLKLQAWTIRE